MAGVEVLFFAIPFPLCWGLPSPVFQTSARFFLRASRVGWAVASQRRSLGLLSFPPLLIHRSDKTSLAGAPQLHPPQWLKDGALVVAIGGIEPSAAPSCIRQFTQQRRLRILGERFARGTRVIYFGIWAAPVLYPSWLESNRCWPPRGSRLPSPLVSRIFSHICCFFYVYIMVQPWSNLDRSNFGGGAAEFAAAASNNDSNQHLSSTQLTWQSATTTHHVLFGHGTLARWRPL